MTNSIEVAPPKSLPGVVAEEIVACIGEAIEENGRCSLVLAGGSSPGATYRLLARPPLVGQIDWDKVHIFLGDERWVPLDDNQSNYNMVKETLLSSSPIPEGNVHPVNTALKTPKAGADAYADTIREVLGVSEGSIPEFDLVLLGIGEDGHTASLFPGSELLDRKDGICFPVKEDAVEIERITLSPAALLAAKKTIFIVRGPSKAEMVKVILEGTALPKEIPAKLFDKSSNSVTWFLDTAAANDLEGV